MQSISWIGFAVNNALTKSVVHFLPTAAGSNAPYPVNFTLHIWNKDFSKNITLDGGRLGQPDGVRLDDVFPDLNDAISGPFGIAIELSAAQQRVDLRTSTCVIEIITAANSVRFFAKRTDKVNEQQAQSALAVKDAFSNSSLILVNYGDSSSRASLLTAGPHSDSSEFSQSALPLLDGKCVMEHSFDEAFFSGVESQECSWGLFKARPMAVLKEESDKVIAYSIYRDTLTKRIISVSAI